MDALKSNTAAELFALAENAKTVADIDPIVDEFTRRLENAKSRTTSRKGKPLSAEFVSGKTAKIEANLAKVNALKDALSPKRKAKAKPSAKPEADAVPVEFAQKFAGLKPAQQKAILALLG